MTWQLDGIPLQSVLVTRLRYLGDVVMSTVVLQALKLGDPDLDLAFLCEQEHGAALVGHPLLDRCHLLQTNRKGADARARVSGASGRSGDLPRPLPAARLVSQVRKQKYDLAVDLFFNPRSAWLLRLAGVPRRIGGARGSRRHLFTHSIFKENHPEEFRALAKLAPGGLGEHLLRLAPLVHEPSGLDFTRWLLEQDPVPRFKPRLADPGLSKEARQALAAVEVDPDQGLILLAPGATWPSKEWPREHWATLIQDLVQARRESLLVVVPPGKENVWAGLGNEIPGGRGGVLPVLPITDIMGLLARAGLLVTVDGGVMHAAVGLGVPTLALFGPTRPDIWFPYEGFGPYRVLCRRPSCHPCNLHQCDEFVCLPELLPETVLTAAADLLVKFGTPRH